MIRTSLLAAAAGATLALPPSAHAQTAADTLPFVLPPASALTCEPESAAVSGVRGYFFGVGTPAAQIRTATGQLLAAGPPPREIATAFDSLGRPVILSDVLHLGVMGSRTALVTFGREGHATGFRQSVATDTAAVMARVRQEGLSALNAAIRENSRTGPRELLDSLALARARALAEYLWGKRCL